MTRCLTVITAVHRPGADFLPAAAETLFAQELPPGWEWQWVVQEDGQTGFLPDLLPPDDRITTGTGPAGGPGVARTLALTRARGELVKVLDADDLLTPGALARDIEVLTAREDVGWTTSRVLDLLPDGSTVGFASDPEEGKLERGVVLDYWRANGFLAQVHPATLCVRRSLLLRLGGWMALPASEDTGLLLAVNAVSLGYFLGEPGLHYRKWPGQITHQPAHLAEPARSARMRLIGERAELLATGWS